MLWIYYCNYSYKINLLSTCEGFFFLIQQIKEACLLRLFMLTMKQLQISLI